MGPQQAAQLSLAAALQAIPVPCIRFVSHHHACGGSRLNGHTPISMCKRLHKQSSLQRISLQASSYDTLL